LGWDFEGPRYAVEVVGGKFDLVDARWEGKSCGERTEREVPRRSMVASDSGWRRRTRRRALKFLPLIDGLRISMGTKISKVATHLSHMTQ
jgi:hypothetical protein